MRFTTLRLTVVMAALCAPAASQSTLVPTRITAPVKDRGVYHLATGTWTRADPSSQFGSEVLFNNSAPSGYFFATTGSFSTVSHGRLPSTTSPSSPTSVVGTADSYTIDCYELSYCSSIPAGTGGVDVELTFYDSYTPCGDVDAPSVGVTEVASFVSTGLAAGTAAGGEGCWTLAFDLSGTSSSFVLRGDGDGRFDDRMEADSFGWGLAFPNAVSGAMGNGTGPIIAGNCPAGGVAGGTTSPQHGFQTKFGGNPGQTDSTGLGTSDFFWLEAPGLLGATNGGCFFFGAMGNGCTDPSVVGSAKNPFSSYYLQLFGQDGGEFLGTKFCSSVPNATGLPASLSVAGSDPHADLVLRSSPVPRTLGQFFYGPAVLSGVPMGLGSGTRCVGGMTVRMLPFVTTGSQSFTPQRTAVLTLSYTAPYAAGLTGTKYFQHWFREPGGMTSNSSDAIGITF